MTEATTKRIQTADATGAAVNLKVAEIKESINTQTPSLKENGIRNFADVFGNSSAAHEMDKATYKAEGEAHTKLAAAASQACAADPTLAGVSTIIENHSVQGGLWKSAETQITHDANFDCHNGKAIPVQSGLPDAGGSDRATVQGRK
jgi:hypothetical protein